MDTSDFPRNLIEFEERFGTEAACLAYVRGKKWPEGFRCSKCEGRASWPVRGGRQEECQGCGHQESVTAGTMFHLTHKSLRLWFRAIMLWVVSKRAMSAKELSRQLGIHYETAWTWCHKLRACVGTAFGQEALHGVVELDESYIGGTDDRAHKGRSLAGCKALIGGAVEVLASGKMGRIRLEHLAAADAKSLENFAVRNIEQHTVARTDGLASYNNLPMVGIGHQRNVIGPDSAKAIEVLPNIHKVFSLFKRVLLGTFQGSVSHKHLWAYLDEFVFRFNRRNSDNRWLLFERIVTAAPRSRPPTMTQITHRAEAPT